LELARCLRDIDDLSTAFATYDYLRRPRVTKIAQEAARRNRHKAASPIVSALLTLAMRLAAKTFLTPERMFGWVHGYRINWDERVTVPAGIGVTERQSPMHTKAVA
jgi:2-polyprenyl-6-methoxyphenol hydroxylase-like FAD-dependent oxidoreductase